MSDTAIATTRTPAEAIIDAILSIGVDGAGPFTSARDLAEEHLAQHADPEVAIDKIISTCTRYAAGAGFVTGLGGFVTLPVTIPADLTVFYALSARCAAAIAHVRGHDIESEEVRSVVLLTLLGSAGAATAAEVGAKIGTKAAMASLKKLPGSALIAINKRVGFRLLTKFGEKGVINLVKLVPVAGGVVGGGMNAAAMKSIGGYAKRNFPA